MSIDVSRYAIITNEFRREYARDTTIATRYKKARVMSIDSNLKTNGTSVTDILNALFAVVGAVRRRFEIVIAGTKTFDVNTLTNGPLGVTLNLPEFSAVNLNAIVTRMTIDEEQDETILEVWG